MLQAHLQAGQSTVVSLLSLEKSIRQEFSTTFEELNQVMEGNFRSRSWLDVDPISSVIRTSPSSFSSRLLDDIFERIQQKQAFGDNTTATFLLHVFSKAAEPLWQMLGRWLRDGIFMPMNYSFSGTTSPLPLEFFIEYNELNLGDPDFWTDGFSLRSRIINNGPSSDDYEVPLFLKPLSEPILSAGKSIGFLRILGNDMASGNGLLSENLWPTFESFLSSLSRSESDADEPNAPLRRSLTTEKLTLLLSDRLLPICEESGAALKRVFFDDCDLHFHLERIEDIFLMRRADIMSDFCDVLFDAVRNCMDRFKPLAYTHPQIDGKKLWTDFYFLNTAFSDVINVLKSPTIGSSLFRISYKADRRHALQRSVVILDGVSFEYAAPFPLTLVFTPDVLQKYNSILILLLQVKRAKAMLDNILLRGSSGTSRPPGELKVFYVMRSKLSWIVK